MGAVQLEFDLETYVNADYNHKTENKRSVSGVAVSCKDAILSSLGRRSASLYYH